MNPVNLVNRRAIEQKIFQNTNNKTGIDVVTGRRVNGNLMYGRLQ